MLTVSLILLHLPADAQILISEFMADNSDGIEDEDGDRSDWIELYNAGTNAVNLGGWHLTDNADKLTKWTFYPTTIEPDEFLVVWTSNKNRKDPDEEMHTNFKLSSGGEYLALVEPDGVTIADAFDPSYPEQASDVSFGRPYSIDSHDVLHLGADCRWLVPTDGSLGLSWNKETFDDSAWTTGVTGLGYERDSGYEGLFATDVESAMYDKHTTMYVRIPFIVPEGIKIDHAEFRIRYDDGFFAYLNGDRVALGNIGSAVWDEDAPNYIESEDYQSLTLSSFANLAHSGTNMLAIHLVNQSADSSDLLLMPEITIHGYTLLNTNMTPVYFTVPTPGAENVGGTPNIGPLFAEETHLPAQPTANEDLTITVEVHDADSVTNVVMIHEVMFSGELTNAMVHAGGDLYTATISASEYVDGEMVRYRFEAIDGEGNASRWPAFHDPLGSPEFFGTMAKVEVVSSMPVYHWFVASTNNMDTGNESRSSIFYDGVLYDNIMTRTRGGSTETATIIKKSHKFDFNRGHHFEYDADERKAEEVNLNTTYTDKTYLRRILAWNSYEKVDMPGCKSFLVHLRRNNEFFGVQNFEEQVDEDYLIRHDFDPDGALYKILGWYDDETTGYKVHHVGKRTRKEEPGTADVDALVYGIQAPGRAQYIFDHMDVANVINYLALLTLMRDGDTAVKNHYYYRDTNGSGDWSVLPWDKDLVFGMSWTSADKILHDGSTPANHLDFPGWGFLQKAVWNSPDLKALYLRRLRTVLDTLLQPASTPLAERYYENLIADLLQTHGTELTMDYNKWGNPWPYGIDFTPEQANTDRTIDTYLNPSRSYFYGNSSVPSAQTASPTIQISHVEVTPASGKQAEEYIELYNPNSTAIDISGWSLSNAVTHVFRGGSVILPNDYFYVSPDTGAFRRRSVSPKSGEDRFVQGPYKGMLSSRGEKLDLYDATGTQKDSETWTENLSDAQRYLRISEVMYHPALPDGSDLTEDRLEFIELKNISSAPLNISETFFTSGIIFTNPSVTLPAGGYLVIARDPVEFANQYDTRGMTVVGPYSGYLANGNDDLELEDSRGETIHRFEYNNDWYSNTDGNGFSLTLIDPANTNTASWNTKSSWRPSLNLGGSPGAEDVDLAQGSLIINEVLAHSDIGGDWVELKNRSNGAIDISHWVLSDDWKQLNKYQIPAGTMLPANGFTVLHETDFNSGADAFALSELGDEVILTRALADGTLQGYQTSHDFDASGKDIPFGRWIDSEGDEQFIPMHQQTPGAANSAPKTDPVLISEIMYAPTAGKAEYIELYNCSTIDQNLFDPLYPTNQWSITGAVEFTFPANQVLPSGSFLVVCSTNPAAFRTQYSIPDKISVFGPFIGNLSNGGERVRLKYPGNPEPAFVPQIQLESVNYKPSAPWPVSLSPGVAIERISANSPANDPASWKLADTMASPGRSPLTDITQLSNDWKTEHFGSSNAWNSGELDDFDLDGENNISEFISGTDPADSNDWPAVEITILPNGNIQVSIPTRTADPVYAFGLQRYYTLQQCSDLCSSWTAHPAADNIKGIGQTLSIEQAPSSNVFSQAQIELK